ncbi:MAG: rRNA maturation RNase YbeY [Candidatus Komeilibacteria bacterium]|jgi:probable rRNA maturation factor|nr:rRNA maturation RNase YbeY [Candidatus Komeilibacteria bacterium]MBT4447233.1 rRNA maturation RNase YbeY [Candidatus Komeilibacteria bacterium]
MTKNKLLNINKRGLSIDFSWLAELEKIVIQKYKLKKQISIALVDAKEITNLNQVYRQKNKVTDVLSFVLDDDYILGEVLICLSQARRQAKEKNNTYKAELQLLTVHGILHLLGYDHEINNKEAKKQERVEQEILSKLNK